MRHPVFGVDGAARRDQRLRDDLPAEHPLQARFRLATAKEVVLQGFEIEQVQEFVDGGHDCFR